jgi:hypothetical protein
VTVKGDITFVNGQMRYTLIGDSALKVDERTLTINPNPDALADPARNALHGAIRPVVFALDPSPASHQRGLEQVRGQLVGSASYRLHVEIRHTGPLVFRFSGNAQILYAEGFRRGDATSFTTESRSAWNHPIDIDIDIDSETGRACFRWGEEGEFATQEWGACG